MIRYALYGQSAISPPKERPEHWFHYTLQFGFLCLLKLHSWDSWSATGCAGKVLSVLWEKSSVKDLTKAPETQRFSTPSGLEYTPVMSGFISWCFKVLDSRLKVGVQCKSILTCTLYSTSLCLIHRRGGFKFNLNANLWHKKNKSDFISYIFWMSVF